MFPSKDAPEVKSSFGSTVSNAAPKVSVIIPAYNSSSYVSRALESVFTQTFRGFEVIVINDGSQDTAELELTLRSYQGRLTYIKQENRGPGSARNAGIRAAKGEFVAFLDSDDSWKPEYLAEQMAAMANTPLVDLVYCDGNHLDQGGMVGKSQMSLSPSKGKVTFRSLLFEECKIFTSLTVARKQAVLDAGLFDEQRFRCEDYDLWLRMAHRGCRMTYHTKALGYHWNRPGSLGSVDELMLASAIDVLSKLERDLLLDAETKRLIYKQKEVFRSQFNRAKGKRHLLAGEVEQARNLLKHASAVFPSSKLQLVMIGLRFAPSLTVMAARMWNGRMKKSNSEKVNY